MPKFLPLEIARLEELSEEEQFTLTREAGTLSLFQLETVENVEANMLNLQEDDPIWGSFLNQLGEEKREKFGAKSSRTIFFEDINTRKFYPGYDKKGKQIIDKAIKDCKDKLKEEGKKLNKKLNSKLLLVRSEVAVKCTKNYIQQAFLSAEITQKRCYGGLLDFNNVLKDFENDTLLPYVRSNKPYSEVAEKYIDALRKGITPKEIALLAPTFTENIEVKLELLIRYRMQGMTAEILAQYPSFENGLYLKAFDHLLLQKKGGVALDSLTVLEALKDVSATVAYYIQAGVSKEKAMIIEGAQLKKKGLCDAELIKIATDSPESLEECFKKHSCTLMPTAIFPDPLASILAAIQRYKNEQLKEMQAAKALEPKISTTPLLDVIKTRNSLEKRDEQKLKAVKKEEKNTVQNSQQVDAPLLNKKKRRSLV